MNISSLHSDIFLLGSPPDPQWLSTNEKQLKLSTLHGLDCIMNILYKLILAPALVEFQTQPYGFSDLSRILSIYEKVSFYSNLLLK